MTNHFWNITTVRGYNMAEVTSALQKSIRRGDEDGALTWAVELDQTGYGAMLWGRLTVITSEDVGLAWLDGPAVIEALFQSWKRLKARKNPAMPERLMIAHAVLLLCRASKSRMVDNAVWATYGHEQPLVSEIPDYALDAHTARGRAMGRTNDTFRDGYAVVNEAFPSRYAERSRQGSREWFQVNGAKQGELF